MAGGTENAGPEAASGRPESPRQGIRWPSPPNLWLLILALVLLLVATAFDVVLHAGQGAGACALDCVRHGDPSPRPAHDFQIWMLSPQIFAALLREIGFALIIAFLIGWLIEEDSKRRQEVFVRDFSERQSRFVEDFSERVSRDVFASVLGKFLPRKFQDAFLDVGKSHTVRTNMVIRYELLEFTDAEVRGIKELKDEFIKLHIFTDYTLENISGSSFDHTVVCAYPLRSESDFHKSLSRIVRIKIGRDEMSAQEIAEGTELADAERRDFAKFSKSCHLQAGEQLQVTYEVVLVKERSDNEVWVSLIPTDQLWIICDVGRLQSSMKFGITAHCPSGMDERLSSENDRGEPSDANGGVWASGGPILPYQSVVFWWRTLVGDEVNERWEAAAPERRAGGEG
ncbi:MAG: hypothetical protein R3C25_13540 [Hyphomonadaceae bacterium]